MFHDSHDVAGFYSSPTPVSMKQFVNQRSSLPVSKATVRLRNAKNAVVEFKKRHRPAILDPITTTYSKDNPSLITAGITPIPSSVDGRHGATFLDKMNNVARTRAFAKKWSEKNKIERLKGRSRTETPAVLKFMEGGMEMDEPSPTDEKNSPPTTTLHPPTANPIIDGWVRSFEVEKSSYDSVAVFAEIRLHEALAATHEQQNDSTLNAHRLAAEGREGGVGKSRHPPPPPFKEPEQPSAVRAALCCDLLLKMSKLFGRYEPIMETLTQELLKCIYVDYDSAIADVPSPDARTFYLSSPYFSLLQATQMHRDELIDELEVYNAGVDLRAAIQKCSVGVKTMFNDARRAIRDIIFRVWATHVRSKKNRMLKFKKRCMLQPWWILWRNRYRRFKAHGYFYDSETDISSGSEEEEEEEDYELSGINLSEEKDEYQRRRTSTLMASKEKETDIMRMESPGAKSTHSDGTVSPIPQLPARAKRPSKGLGNFKRLTKKVEQRNSVAFVHTHKHEHKELKIISEEVVGLTNPVVILHCERRARHVDLQHNGCQTEPVTFGADADPAAATPEEEGRKASLHVAKAGKNPTLKAILGKGKEKAMGVEAAMSLIPDIYDQYLTMLSNPGPDTIGKHLNLVTFTKNSLVRKFGIKVLAQKHLKGFVALLLTKKSKEHSRLRVFATLFGLGGDGRNVEDAAPYDERNVDFFFKKLLIGLFPNIKSLEGCFKSKNRTIATDDATEKMENIFENIQKKGGFQLPHMQREVERLPQMKSKGIEYVNCDDLIEQLFKFSQVDMIMEHMTFKNVRCVITFQQKYMQAKRLRAKHRKGEEKLAAKYNELHGDEIVSEAELEFLLNHIGCPAHHHSLEKIWKEFVEEVEKEEQRMSGGEKLSVGVVFAKHVWSSGLRPYSNLEKFHKEDAVEIEI